MLLKKPFPDPRLQSQSPITSPKGFIISPCTVKSSVYLELIFIRYRPNFIFYRMDIQLSQHRLLKSL